MIKRNLLKDLTDHLSAREISLVTGPRQSGKTTLINMLRQNLEQQGRQTLYLNLDVEWDNVHFTSQLALVKKLELELGKNAGIVFIDEIQRKENAGLFLKGLYDLSLPYKFIVTGSGSLELKERIHESLVGRKRLFELTTLNFDEFFQYKTGYRYADAMPAYFESEKGKTLQLLIEYMSYGGYPRVVLEEKEQDKLRIIDEIGRSIIEKDVAYLLKVDKTDAFSHMLRALAGRTGSPITYAKLSKTLSVSFQTIKKYLWYAQKIFLIELVASYGKNPRKEITQAPAAYFWDLGLRNYALGVFGRNATPTESGFLFQNFIFLLLREKMATAMNKVRYWRTKDKAEVDFVLEQGESVIPIEIKYSRLKKEEIPRSLRSFIERYKPPVAYLVNLDFKKEVTIGTTKLIFIPWHELLFIQF